MSPPPFTTLTGVAAPMPQDNIDTDVIFPARFLLITARDGLGTYAFHDRRTDADYVLNQPAFRDPPFLVAGDNFGSGSSREQAVWALTGLGVRCVIAPGFGEIFHGNCLRNGLLPITLAADCVARLLDAAAAQETFTVDLSAQTLTVSGDILVFDITPERKAALLNGWDETSLLLTSHAAAIDAFEARQWEVRALFVPGMTARDYPRHRPQNLLFPDADLDRLRAAGIPVPTAAEADRDEAQLFEVLKTRASETLILTTSARDTSGQSAVPSAYFTGPIHRSHLSTPEGKLDTRRQPRSLIS